MINTFKVLGNFGLIPLITIVCGSVVAYAGLKIHETIISAIGFFAGSLFGSVIYFTLFLKNMSLAKNNIIIILVFILISGILGSLLASKLEQAALAILGLLIGYFIGVIALSPSLISPSKFLSFMRKLISGQSLIKTPFIQALANPLLLIPAIAVASIFIWKHKAGIILYTSFFGAGLVQIGAEIGGLTLPLPFELKFIPVIFTSIFLSALAIQGTAIKVSSKLGREEETEKERRGRKGEGRERGEGMRNVKVDEKEDVEEEDFQRFDFDEEELGF